MTACRDVRGFTLIELMVCLAIIGLLAGLVVAPTMAHVLDRAEDACLMAIAHDLQDVSLLPILYGQDYVVKIGKDGYQLCVPPNLSISIGFTPWPSGIKLDTNSMDLKMQIRFYASGKCSVDKGHKPIIHFKTTRGNLRKVILDTDGNFTWE